MKKLCAGLIASGYCLFAVAQKKSTFNDTAYLQPIEVSSVRAADKSPFTKTNISKKEIEQKNLGQDLPIILDQTPSAVSNSDAGNGVGYTGIRIRGTDATRINVTINGIAYNDAESQGVFFVNLPDIASSANSIQVQRGVGASTNGPGAFGATINLSTNDINPNFYAASNNSIGSFNTWKNNIQFGSGIINKHFTIDARLSKISSDGYIDRAATNLQSYFLSTAYVGEKNSFRFNIFSGKEKTYQAWNGVSESLLTTNRTYNISGQEQPKTPYENETDNYKQTHYQFFYNQAFNKYWKGNVVLFYTKGSGYYEEYRKEQAFATYGLSNYVNTNGSLTSKTDMIRQLWLDNDFFGGTFSVEHKKNNTNFTASTSISNYNGNHFGFIKWAALQRAVPLNYQWYNLPANKKDVNVFGKWTEQWNKNWQSYLDVQIRNVNYSINGFRKNPNIILNNSYTFINPKLGVVFNKNQWQAYTSIALGSKEPNRDDFEANTQQPKAENLLNIETGFERKNSKYAYSANVYYMRYKNQLVLTGKINDVGAYTRENIANSYRVGIELQGKIKPTTWLQASGNIAFSQNKVIDFTEYIDDYDNGGQIKNNYKNSDIAFSPAIVAGSTISFFPFKNAEIALINKYVGRQYLDNTTNKNRSINPYYLQNIQLNYLLEKVFFKETTIILQLNNLFNKQYEANGYTFSYLYGGTLTTENYFYPMAPFNFMFGVNVKL